MIFSFRRGAANRRAVEGLNEAVVRAVRQPVFYLEGGVADTFEGRFELLVLHASLVLRRLQALPDPAPAVAQDLTDLLFGNLDPALRELGVGDMAVPKRMKRLAEAFLGRAVAYATAMEAGDGAALDAALARNVLGGTRDAPGLAAYMLAAARALDRCDLSRLIEEGPPFPDPAAFLAEDKP